MWGSWCEIQTRHCMLDSLIYHHSSSFTNPRAVNGLGSKTPTIGMPINEENRLLVYGGKLMNLAYSDGSEYRFSSLIGMPIVGVLDPRPLTARGFVKLEGNNVIAAGMA
jgi:hypothetical protein